MASYEDFLRPDGSFDVDGYLTANLTNEERKIIRRKAAASLPRSPIGADEPHTTENVWPGHAAPVPRVEDALAGAPRVDSIAGLAEGSSTEPATPDAAAAALEKLTGKKASPGWSEALLWQKVPRVEYDFDATKRNPEVPGVTAPIATSRVFPDLKIGGGGDPATEFADPFGNRDTSGPDDFPTYPDDRPTLSGAMAQAAEYKRQQGLHPMQSAEVSNNPKIRALIEQAKRYQKQVEGPTVEGVVPPRPAPRPQARRAAPPPPLETGARGLSPEPERPTFTRQKPTVEAAGRPEVAIQQTKVAGDEAQPDQALLDAQTARDRANFLGAVATQGGRIADIAAGTKTPDPGEQIRENAGTELEDLLGGRQRKQQEQDRGLKREALTLDIQGRRQKAQQEADFNDPASRSSANARATAVALYPEVVKAIPPEQFRQMSAADIDTLLGEAQPAKPVKFGGAGGGLSGAQMNAVRKGMPQHLVDAFNGIGRVKSLVQSMGGWSKTKTGIAGGMFPAVMMDKNTRALRQELGGVVARFLQAGGGKSITANEERVLIGRIAADPTSANLRPEDLERGLAIIERSLAGDTRQALSGVPESAKAAILNDMGIPVEWMNQNLQAPLGRGGVKKKLRNPQTGEVIEVQ